MQFSTDTPLTKEQLLYERQQQRRAAQRLPYVSFLLIHLALAFFLGAFFLVDHLSLAPSSKILLRIGLIAGATLLLSAAWAHAVLSSRRFKRALVRWHQVEVAYEQQERYNRLKDQFLIHVSHELRTPLTELSGFLELLSMYKDGLDATTQTFLHNALESCSELVQLVNTILDAIDVSSMSKAGQCDSLALAQIAHNVLASFSARETYAYTITVDIPDNLCVWANKQYLHQILRNLLSNAFKYCPPGAVIGITAAPAEGVSLQETARFVWICVQDNGPGIPPAEQRLLFQRFVRLQRDMSGSVRGMGLGLYISKQLAEAMGGRMWVESAGNPGEGSRFCFILPGVPRTPPVP